MVYVMVDEPQGGHYGSMVAGPVFQETMIDAMRWLGVRPSEPIPRKPEPQAKIVAPPKNDAVAEAPPAITASAEDAGERLPDLRGLGVGEAVARVLKLGARVEIVGTGIAVEQSLPPGSVASGALVKLTFRPPG